MVGKIGERKRLTDFIKEHNQVFVSLRHNHAPKNFLFFSLCVLMFFHHRVIGSIIFRSFSLAHHRLLRIGTETRKKTREGKKNKKKPVRGVAQENSFFMFSRIRVLRRDSDAPFLPTNISQE